MNKICESLYHDNEDYKQSRNSELKYSTVNDNSNSCGGRIEYTWEFSEPCGRTISHTQLITIEEAPEPEFADSKE